MSENNKDIHKMIQDLQWLLKRHSVQSAGRYRSNLAAMIEVTHAVRGLVDTLREMEQCHQQKKFEKAAPDDPAFFQQTRLLIAKLIIKKDEFLQAYINRFLHDNRN